MIDIIIVTYNSKKHLLRCVQAIKRCTSGIDYRITIVDNKSSDGTRMLLKKGLFSDCQIFFSKKNLGFSGAANFAMKQTHAPWVVFLDDDAEVKPDWLKNMMGHIRRSPKIGIVSGKFVFPGGKIASAEFGLYPFGCVGLGEVDKGQRDYVKSVDAVPGPCWLMRRSVFKRVGAFDEKFFPSQYEDIDYCIRTRLKGYKIIYDGKITTIHHNLYRIGASKQYIKNQNYFIKKWGACLHRFPLTPHTAADKLIPLGVDLFRKNPLSKQLFKTGEVFLITTKDGVSFEPFYQGIAHYHKGRYKEAYGALSRFAQSLKKVKWNYMKTKLHFIISEYYRNMGFDKEANKEHSIALRHLGRLR